ncbi:unnamed protein product [Tilletia controversa]|uniref:Cytochrome P450 n=2 Tax=Tilletia TaxID=13289 RepID=A0A8X7MUW3_9BASI|nr:hypothetical protein CF336_g3694 [Tilletia laevis]KAE8198769.1 hypothetical protein CF328_g3458 [Tilletia controversa]KAE8261625.1 hypothetical protein A4X03_0g3098 [Tilletia caries]KAE8203747.1 hypothetical protein CF335_g2910 [Tilletia laevis]KAE8248123.1 hypothetical protein A4X06_0g3940 [Tilletia controversa]
MASLQLGSYQQHITPLTLAATFIVSAVTYVFYLVWLRPHYFPRLKGIPGPPLKGWMMGHLADMLADEPERAVRRWHEQYGKEKGAFRIVSAVGLERLVVTRYSTLKQILVNKPYEFPKPSWAARILQSVVGEGLLTYEGKPHRDLRMYMNKAFSQRHLQAQYELYHTPVQNFLKIIRAEIDKGKGQTTMDMYAWSSRCLLDIIGRAAFGIEIDSLHHDKSPLGTAYHDLVSLQTAENLAAMILVMNLPFNVGSKTIYWLSSKPWGSDFLKSVVKWGSRVGLGFITNELKEMAIFVRSMYAISTVATELREEKIAEAKKLGPNAVDMGKIDVLSLLVSASILEDSAYKMTNEDVKNSVLTVLGAGHETTASGCTWTLWLLAQHQDVQDRLRAECQELLSVYENPPFDKLKELPWLNAVVKESLRVEPPVPATVRQAKHDSVVDGIFIPKSTIIFIPSLVINTDIYGPWGADAHEFKPERWLNLPADYDASVSLMTFITGAHGCIAKTMAQTEMALMTCMLIANFKFEAPPGYKPVRESSITMRPVGGLPLLISHAPGRNAVAA